MKDLSAVRTNEKLKRASTIFGNGGLALFVAGLSRWYTSGADIFTGVWIVIAICLMLTSVQVNELLQPEDE